MNLKELFFNKENGNIIELDKPVTIEKFHSILILEFNFCNDYRIDYDYFNILYLKYIDVFNKNIGSFVKYFKNIMKENGIKNIRIDNIKPYMVFGDNIWKKSKSTTDILYYKNRGYKIEYIDELIKNRQSLTSKESFKKRYGDDWEIHFNEYIEKHKKSLNSNPNIKSIKEKIKKNFTYEYFLDKINPETKTYYTIEEAKKLLSERCKESSKKISIKRKGKSGITCRSIKYWIDKGFDENYAKNKVKEIQSTNTIEKYIKKYGEQEGIKRWILRNKLWGENMQKKRMESGKIGCAYSLSSKIFFDKLVYEMKNNGIKFNDVYYGEKEFCKWDSKYKRPYFYDFVIPELKLCIEYNGIKFHPKEFDTSWVGLYGETYEYKINYDKRKCEVIKNYGYNVIVVWENDDLDKKIKDIISIIS